MFTVTLTECGTGKKESWFVTQKAVEAAIKSGRTYPYYAIVAAVRKGWGNNATYRRDTGAVNIPGQAGIYIRVFLMDKGTLLHPLYRVSVKTAKKLGRTPKSYLETEGVPEYTRDFLWRACTALKLKDHANPKVAEAIGICLITYLAGIKKRNMPKSWLEKLVTTHLLNPEYLRTGHGLPYLVPSSTPHTPEGETPCEK